MQIVVARERASQDRPARFCARGLRKELGLPYWREHVEELVSRHRNAHDRRNRQNAVHDGRAADPYFRRWEVGQLRKMANDECLMTKEARMLPPSPSYGAAGK